MTRLKTLAAAISVIGLIGVATPSLASPLLVFKDGATTYSVDPFNGFDWQSNATAVVSPPVFDGVTPLTTSFLASAGFIKLTGGGNAALSGLGTQYEFTVRATVTETVTCAVWAVPNVSCQIAAFTATGGTYDIYYDSVADSNIIAGTGFTDGAKILSGTINAGFAGLFGLLSPTSGSGNFSFVGTVTDTETSTSSDAYFAPALVASNASSTLQIGTATTSWTAPTSWVDGGGIPAGSLLFQADGNQTFVPATTVPEPGSLALVGLALAGVGLARRRHGKK